VTEYRDGTKISAANGIKMMKVFRDHQHESSIFDEFDYMDQREEELRYQRELSTMMYDNMKKMMGFNSPVNEQKGDDRRKRRFPKKGGFRKTGNTKD
jgi:hypothetical protein